MPLIFPLQSILGNVHGGGRVKTCHYGWFPGLLGSWERFRERFAAPIERGRDGERQAALARLVRPFLLRRLKSAGWECSLLARSRSSRVMSHARASGTRSRSRSRVEV